MWLLKVYHTERPPLQEYHNVLAIAAFMPVHLQQNNSFPVVMPHCVGGVLNEQSFHFVFMMTIVYVNMWLKYYAS